MRIPRIEYFIARSIYYRRLSAEALDQRMAEQLAQTADLFSKMAEDYHLLATTTEGRAELLSKLSAPKGQR